MAVLAATVTFGLASGPASARSRIVLKQDLARSGVDDDARGRTRFVLRANTNGRFDLSVKHMSPDSLFEVIVDDTRVGTLQTRGSGNGKARFRTNPRRDDQLLGFDPRGARVVLRDDAGADILTGTIPDDSLDPNEVACCLEAECEDRTADACTAAGGTVTTATSCLPDPCAAVSPGGAEVVCCIPDDQGPECEDRTAAECALQGGTVVMATSCDPNPCAATPAVNEDRCCLPEDAGFECESLTSAECATRGGTDVGPGSCAPDSCATLPPPPAQTIQCCLANNSGAVECEDRSAADCAANGGVDMGAGTCSPDPCAGGTGVDDHGGGN